jgi:hypothetical protein
VLLLLDARVALWRRLLLAAARFAGHPAGNLKSILRIRSQSYIATTPALQ